jgi:hypothetical protein
MIKRKLVALLILLLVLGFGLIACAPGTELGDPERGKQVYNTAVEIKPGDRKACEICHPVVAGEKPKFPMGINLSDVGRRAASVVPGQSAEDYLRTSIVDPDAHLAGGFQDGLMSRDYRKLLTAQQIEDLVAYMVTLK